MPSCGPRAVTKASSSMTLLVAMDMPAKVALASKMADLTSARSLPKETSSARDLVSGANHPYLRTVADPHLPWIWMRHTSIPLEARNIAPVTLKLWPVKRGAPDRVCNSRPKSSAIFTMDSPVAVLDADSPLIVGNSGEFGEVPLDEA